MKPAAALLLCLLLSAPSWSPAADLPTSEGAATIETPAAPSTDELVLRLANESNPVDGPLGPVTYGVRAAHTFRNRFALEAGFFRMHEPGMAALHSVVDEAQLTGKCPEARALGQRWTVGVTAWRNRMIDMYTNLGGVELTRIGGTAVTAGGYLGTATREDLSRRFFGGQIGATHSFGPFDLGLAYLGGLIEGGPYRKAAFEASYDMSSFRRWPLALTFNIEERFFRFGHSGVGSEPADEFIFVTGLEVRLDDHFRINNRSR